MVKLSLMIDGRPTEVELSVDELVILVKKLRSEKEPRVSELNVTKTKIKMPSYEEVKEFILTKSAPDFKHTMEEVMIHFLGKKIIAKEVPNVYNNFYMRVIRARKKIGKQLGGKWTVKNIGNPFRGGYKEYYFKKETYV